MSASDPMPAAIRSFDAPFAPEEPAVVTGLMAAAPPFDAAAEARIDATALALIAAIRGQRDAIGGVEELLHAYSLSTKEGLALMVLAEALLRVPDAATADLLIEDKIGHRGRFEGPARGTALLIQASAWALGVTARIIDKDESPEGIVHGLARRLGMPAVRIAARQVVRLMGDHFVMGETIGDALDRIGGGQARRYRYSFDMLGEGARTAVDAERYLASYADAIAAIGTAAGSTALPDRPGISVKLSALHPRYEATSADRVLRELVPRVLDLARAARRHELNFTIDAEEADRLELSLDVVAAVLRDASLAGWDGFGLAVQAYQKRAAAVIDWCDDLAKGLNRRLMLRLVKGAYWDTEIKRAQERGLADFPVLTRKSATDLSYLVCARRLLVARPRLYPQFATHNALTVATLLELASGGGGFEFQRLHGMGDALYEALLARHPAVACRVYAPVGSHRDLLAYLVRRLLENGANSSFVARITDPTIAPAELTRRPQAILSALPAGQRRGMPPPPLLYAPDRSNSAGVELGARAERDALQAEIAGGTTPIEATSLIDGRARSGTAQARLSPTDAVSIVGRSVEATPADADAAMDAAARGFAAWSQTPVELRAACLERLADRLQAARGRLIALLHAEAGRTLDDSISEVREAIDFCRYYAAEARRLIGTDLPLPGPTGEDNRLTWRARGVFVCISPWNFPLAIFLGQITAALVCGNAVVAKPAEQTPLIGYLAVRLAHESGIPPQALQLVLGDGRIGARLTQHPALAGVAFTGSGETASLINRALAAREGPIVPLIAETGGINAMIVDATALPEQVTDDVVASAFRSAGQRCSALRLLCLQEDIADRCLEMIAGAARELKIGDPRDPSVQVGPVIDAEARDRLLAHIAAMQRAGARPGLVGGPVPQQGWFVAPHVFEIARATDLRSEVFGPVLHVVRWRADRLDRLLQELGSSGWGLTFGLQTRIDETVERAVRALPVGNVYVNRNIIGAVVGTQPFGGIGLSGTGPKAGGPSYLKRFAVEQVISINTAAAGGNAALLAALPLE